jgi:hypothetical protein
MFFTRHKLKQFLLRLGRDLILLFIVLQLVELWQSRAMLTGNLPFNPTNLTALNADHPMNWKSDQYHLIYAFAPWCSICRMSASNLNRLKSLSINTSAIALSYGDVKDVQDFVATTGLEIPVLLADESNEAALSVTAFPSYFLLSPEGEIVKSWSGYTTTAGIIGRVLWMRIFKR